MANWDKRVDADGDLVELLRIPFDGIQLSAAADEPTGPPNQVVIEIEAPPVEFAGHPLGIVFRNAEDLRSFASNLLEIAIECWGPKA